MSVLQTSLVELMEEMKGLKKTHKDDRELLMRSSQSGLFRPSRSGVDQV